MKNILFSFIILFFTTINIKAQQKPTLIVKSDPVQYIAPLSSQKSLPAPKKRTEEINPKRIGQNTIVPGKGLPLGNDPLLQPAGNVTRHATVNPILTFQGTDQGMEPSDPTGAAGPNHYVMAYNIGFKIFDKNGNVLINDTDLSVLFPNYYNDGDPIVLYDQFADRFLITNFDIHASPNKLLIAISQTSDPVNGGWYTYAFDITGDTPDYPKFSIWSDGYYITVNKNPNAVSDEVIYVMERDQMINGAPVAQLIGFPLPGISTNGFYSPAGFNINGMDLPPAGNAPIVYLQDDSWSGVNQDHLKIWNVNVDWNTPSNSTISVAQELNTTPFNSVFNNGYFNNLPQPNGIYIDALQATVMFMTNYRRFQGYNSVVLNFVVNTDGNGKAGIRWFELRQNNDGDPWYIYQEGTFIDPSNHNTFAGSINMDSQGNIGLGYTIVDSNQVPELHFTGRYIADPAGQMTIAPITIVPGVASDPSYRYGDYAQLTIDPTDNKTFWFISEYFTNSARIDQVGVFKIASDFDNDVGVAAITQPVNSILSANENITITIANYGLQPQSNFPVSYQIDGGNVVTENFTGTIASGTSANFTFSTTADLSITGHTYTITAETHLANDEDNTNDAVTVNVTHLPANDMGVTDWLAPVSDENLDASEPVSITVRNFGGQSQSNIPVSYTVNGNTVNEVITGPIAPFTELEYTFSQPADFSNEGLYTVSASTHLTNDFDPSNDSFSRYVSHNSCQPSGNCLQGDFISRLQYGSIDNISGCGGFGYQDFTYLSTEINIGETTPMDVRVEYSQEHLTAWIDFNDDYNFDNSEKIIDNYIFAPGQNGSGTYSHTFNINMPSNTDLGEHLMRLRINWDAAVPDACANVNYGETEDYVVKIVDPNAIDPFENSRLIIQDLSENHFLITLENIIQNPVLTLEVYSMGGKQIVYHRLKKVNGKYTYDLDLSYVSKGVYLLKIGNKEGGKIKKLIVK